MGQTNYYRPMLYLVYMLEYCVFGIKPWGYHLVNAALSAAVSAAVLLAVDAVIRRRGGGRLNPGEASKPAFYAAALYVRVFGEEVFAERYLYLSAGGFALLIVVLAAGAVRGRFFGDNGVRVTVAALTAVAVLYAAVTVTRSAVWENNITLWSDAVEKSPDSAMARSEFAAALESRGDYSGAAKQYGKAAAIAPYSYMIRYNLANFYLSRGRLDDAVGEYSAVIRLNPDFADAHNNLGIAYAGKGQLKEAAGQFVEALRLNPGHGDARQNLERTYKMIKGENVKLGEREAPRRPDGAAVRRALS